MKILCLLSKWLSVLTAFFPQKSSLRNNWMISSDEMFQNWLPRACLVLFEKRKKLIVLSLKAKNPGNYFDTFLEKTKCEFTLFKEMPKMRSINVQHVAFEHFTIEQTNSIYARKYKNGRMRSKMMRRNLR
jgi:hypothetical protein